MTQPIEPQPTPREIAAELIDKVSDLVRTATVTVEWPDDEPAEVCNCCFVDGHTRRCGRYADSEVDVPPFGVLAVATVCKQRINGTTPAA